LVALKEPVLYDGFDRTSTDVLQRVFLFGGNTTWLDTINGEKPSSQNFNQHLGIDNPQLALTGTRYGSYILHQASVPNFNQSLHRYNRELLQDSRWILKPHSLKAYHNKLITHVIYMWKQCESSPPYFWYRVAKLSLLNAHKMLQ
jgi:hypothetical protein